MLFVALAVVSASAASAEFDIVEAGRVYQQGSYPYLEGYAGKPVNSRQECEKACQDTEGCKFGTYVTKDAESSDGYNYQNQAKAGECWLSAQTHSTPTPCGVPCVGFKKVEKKPDDPNAPADACTKDVETCWNGKALGRISETTCKTHGVADDVCAAKACQFGEIIENQIRWGCEKREECTCDPSLHPSHFNTCHKDPWSGHIVVTHLPRRFHAKTFEEGAQHRCAMVGGGSNPVCQCCTCMRGTHSSDGFLDLGRESHPVLPDNAHFETKDADSFEDCESQCENADCKWGSYIARMDAKASCVISFSDAVKTADHKLKTVRCPPTTDKCHSFLHPGLEAGAVDAGNSKAFIKKSVSV